MRNKTIAFGLSSIMQSLFHWVWLSPRDRLFHSIVEESLVFLGVIGGLTFLAGMGFPIWALCVAVAAPILLQLGSKQTRTGRAWLLVRMFSRPCFLIIVAFFLYQAVTFGYMLAWSIHPAALLLTSILFLASLISCIGSIDSPRVPLVFPLGVFISLCLLGWKTEASSFRCSDHEKVNEQIDVTVALASVADIGQCSEGTRLHPKGHPRKFFSGSDPDHLYLSVDYNNSTEQDPGSVFYGGVCEITLPTEGSTKEVNCTSGLNTVHGFVYLKSTNEILTSGYDGLQKRIATTPFRVLSRLNDGDRKFSSIYYIPTLDPKNVFVFFDDQGKGETVDIGTLNKTGELLFGGNPEELRYHPESREGIFCTTTAKMFAMSPYMSLAFRDDIANMRPLGTFDSTPWALLSFSDGCDLDSRNRKAYLGIGTLGMIAITDYDSGDVEDWMWAGFGVRPVVLNRDGTRLYTANYLTGEVKETDLSTRSTSRTWFVGRFVRHLFFDEQQSHLYASSTLGVVQVQLR